MTGPIPREVAERAAMRYLEDVVLDCWISTYSRGSHGYAQVGWQVAPGKRETTTAHRAAWTYWNGPIPEGLTVDHQCRVRPCVNPSHLRLLPNGANAADNGQVKTNPGTGIYCSCGEEKVMREGAKYQPYCRPCQNRRRRDRRAAGKAN